MSVATVLSVQELVKQAKDAQKVFETFNQQQVDAIVKVIGKIVYDRAEELAKMAVEESGMGVYEDKVLKKKGKSRIIWNNLKNVKSVDIIGEDKAKGLYYVAKPMGVVGAVTPCTNPAVTPMCNAMFALKGRNAIIIAPHPRGQKLAEYLVELFSKEIEKLGAPKNLIQVIREGSIEKTNELMKSVDVVVATGGMAMVRSAYSSGKPSYGVGAGNVQCIIDRDVDLNEAMQKIVTGAAFDNGIICSSEQSAIIPEEKYEEAIQALKNTGKVFYAEDEATVDKFRKVLYDEKGVMNKDVVGQSAQKIGKMAGVEVPDNVKVLAFKVNKVGREEILCKEKLCAAIVTIKYKTFEEAVEIAQKNLDFEGRGHSAAIHSNNLEHIQYAGTKLTVSRLVVNQASSLTAGGSFFNGFAPTTTLGCGSWGNNSISENLDWKHLVNISRIGMIIEGATQPSDEQIWS